MTSEDIALPINAARLSGKAGIKVHVFALGEEALSYLQAAVGIADAACGARKHLVVGVDYIQVVNQTIGQKAPLLRLAADGFFRRQFR